MVFANDVENDSDYLDLELASSIINKVVTDIPDDLIGIVRAPFDSPDAARDYALILGGLILTDKYTTEFYQDHIEDQFDALDFIPIEPNGDKFPSSISSSGRYLVLGLSGAYAGSVIASDAKGQAAALLSAKAMTYSYITSHVILKTLFGRNRPHRYLSNCSNAGEVIEPGFTCDNLDFGNGRDNVFKSGGAATAMPSFHATMLFSVARVYQQTYDDYLIPYSVAAALFAHEGKGHNHWISDLFLGGIIGTVIGDVVTDNFFGDNKDLSVVPIINNESQGMALSYRF
jgi:uncharacterized membrane protein YeaQ/YmgE (transglycosylase-associated protein family)